MTKTNASAIFVIFESVMFFMVLAWSVNAIAGEPSVSLIGEDIIPTFTNMIVTEDSSFYTSLGNFFINIGNLVIGGVNWLMTIRNVIIWQDDRIPMWIYVFIILPQEILCVLAFISMLPQVGRGGR